jgi:hypothetical protein
MIPTIPWNKIITVAVILAAGVLIGLAIDRLLIPPKTITVTKTELRTNNITNTKYRWYTTNDVPADCGELLDRYGRLWKSYSNYVSCKPFNVTSGAGTISWQLGNDDVTNTYALNYTTDKQPFAKLYVGAAYSLNNSIGVSVGTELFSLILADYTLYLNRDMNIGARIKVFEW